MYCMCGPAVLAFVPSIANTALPTPPCGAVVVPIPKDELGNDATVSASDSLVLPPVVKVWVSVPKPILLFVSPEWIISEPNVSASLMVTSPPVLTIKVSVSAVPSILNGYVSEPA